MPPSAPWQIWIDTGGTFTDCIATDPDGKFHRLKILSSSVIRGTFVEKLKPDLVRVDVRWPVQQDIFENFEVRPVGTRSGTRIRSVDLAQNIIQLQAPIKSASKGQLLEISSNEEVPVLAARLLTATAIKGKFPTLEMKLGSTRGTNAILEYKGAKTAFLVTRGFKDLLLIGNQQRPDLFSIHVVKPRPLYEEVFEVPERIAADGRIIQPLDAPSIQSLISALKKKKIQSVAIALLHSYINPTHELMLERALRDAGFSFVSVSNKLSPQIKIVPRAETAVANAYLDPIIHTYVDGIRRGLAGSLMKIMTSSGSLVQATSFYPKDSLLSGPAGGVVGAAHQASRSGHKKIIAFDMGGTSTDVSMYNERFDYRFESRVGHHKILSPALAIETIAAGGGSICDFDGFRLTVGPHSAGATPGPACYGAGGPLTLTDVNVLMGRIDPAEFAIPLRVGDSERALLRLMKKMNRPPARDVVLESLAQIANEKMAEAIKKISVQEGHNPKEFALLSFGGAGGQHACSLARSLGMTRVITPYDAGLLSAYGIGQAGTERFEEKQVLQLWKQFAGKLVDVLQELYDRAKQRLTEEGNDPAGIRLNRRLLYLRFTGQDTSIEIEHRPGLNVETAFREKYEGIFGHWTEREIQVDSVRVIAVVARKEEKGITSSFKRWAPKPKRYLKTLASGKRRPCGVYVWEELSPGATVKGPALVVSGNSTTFIEPFWVWKLDNQGNALLNEERKSIDSLSHSKEAQLELFTNRFTALAQEMGALLQRTSFSVNVKERLDFSCAVLDSKGHLVVNAPHIPVHLGSLGVCVREVCKTVTMRPGDVIITNHPGAGGSHLPDITLIKPVFLKKELIGFVANRAHHAEIGGSMPGSMPPNASSLAEEGVIISPTRLVSRGEALWEPLRKLFLSGPYPTRAIDENFADLNGGLAAVNMGDRGLVELCQRFGKKDVTRYMTELRSYASSLLRQRIRMMTKKTMSSTEKLDDGSVLSVAIKVVRDRMRIDFTGSSGVHHGNLNATRAIVQSVVLYCLRLLIDRPLPMNEGLMDPVDIILPQGLLNPRFDDKHQPAVVGGNTEVSQRLTDTMLKAFGLVACSQGTMNNFLFGNERFGYYETICGGTGAGPGFAGTDAVHQHMTNTRITDPEMVEFRYPVQLERFEIRRGSGGKGKWSGGDGVTREFIFLKDLDVSLLSQHRVEQPYGMKGGGPGKCGDQWLIRSNGTKEKLGGMDSVHVSEGDRLTIQTPGGGAWGK